MKICQSSSFDHLPLIVLVLVSGALSGEQIQLFNGDQVLRVLPPSQHHVNLLQKLEARGTFQLDFWKEPYYPEHSVDFRVPFNHLQSVKKWLERKGMQFSVQIEDVQRLIDHEFESIRSRRDIRNISDDLHFLNNYNSHDEINDWLDRIAERCGRRCSLYTIGQTLEGRKLKLIKIGGMRHRNSLKKQAVWIDGGIHAREWISPAAAVNFIHKLVTENTTDRCTRHLVEALDWYILPVVNPDGYEYSRAKNRMWRKNRKPHSAHRPWWSYYYYGQDDVNTYCHGVDLNRNFGYYWGEVGSSTRECSDVYGGKSAFSEREPTAVKNFLESINNVKIFMSLHAYGQYWLYSWGYTRQVTEDQQSLDQVASAGARAISRASQGRTNYTVGSASRTLYASSGASDDWAKGDLGVKYSFTLELPPADADVIGNGFILPVSAIPGVVSDTWPGIQAMAVKALQMDRSTPHYRHNLCRF